jgi:cytochrome c oxidase subunit III
MTQSLTVKQPLRNADILLVAFLGTVVMLFAGFTSAFLIRRTGSDWSPIQLPGAVWFSAVVLVLSSLSTEVACRGRRRVHLMISLALGFLFLGGQLAAWNQLTTLGAGMGENAYGSFFYMLSAVHGVHLLGGLGGMIYVSLRQSGWRRCANYWHFMGVVWIYVLLLLLAA